MSLSSASALNSQILGLSPSDVPLAGLSAFADVIVAFTLDAQAGPTGSPGILTLNKPAMMAILLAQVPTSDSSWIIGIANAWEAGVSTGTVLVGTVSNPAWIGSGGSDILAVISNVSAAKAVLIAGLSSATPDSSAALPMATAIRDATLTLKFVCTGLGPPPASAPIPLTLNAE